MKFQLLRDILLIAEILSCVMAFIAWPKLKNSFWAIFPFYLLFIVIAEVSGKLMTLYDLKSLQNTWFTFIVIPVEFIFFYWLYLRSFSKYIDKIICKSSVIIFILALLLEIIFFRDSHAVFLSLSYTTGNFLLLVTTIIFLYRLIQSDDILYFRTNILFWVSIGLLLFYFSTFPLFGLYGYLSKNHAIGFKNYFYLMYMLNIMMYLIFSFALLWTKPRSISS